METKENLAVWIGAIASVVLVILYFVTQSNNSGGGNVEQVYQVSGITPETASIFSNERVAKAQIQSQTALGWISYLLGSKQSDNETNVALAQTSATKEIAQIEATSNTAIAQTTANAAIQSAQSEANATIQSANAQANAQIQVAAKQASASKVGSIFGTIGKVLSFL